MDHYNKKVPLSAIEKNIASNAVLMNEWESGCHSYVYDIFDFAPNLEVQGGKASGMLQLKSLKAFVIYMITNII